MVSFNHAWHAYKQKFFVIYLSMKYLLKTPYQCLVKTKTQSVELDINDTLECEDEQMLFIYPTTSEQIPFCVNLSNKKDTDQYSFLRHNDQNIIFLEKPEKFDIFQKENLNFSGKHCHVSISKNKVYFETDKQKIKCFCGRSKTPPKVFKLKNFACVQLEKDFFAYSMQTEKLSHLCGETISFDKDTVAVTKKYCDSKCHEKVSRYEIGDEIKLKDEQIISTQKQEIEDKNLISYKFLECVKSNDFSQSQQYLSESLSGKIGEDQIKSFFGFLSDFLPLSANEFLAISGSNKKYVTFDLLNGKINDISIDEL